MGSRLPTGHRSSVQPRDAHKAANEEHGGTSLLEVGEYDVNM